jgi:TolB-like protein
MPDPPRYQRLKERKLVQWALAYLAGAFVVFQLLDALETPLGLTATIQQGILAIVVIGFVLTLVLAWFHGEKGRQRVSLPELLTISALLIGCGITVWLVGPFRETSQPTGAMGETGDLIATVPLRAVLYENPSVALLPLRNLGGPEDEPFVEGLHDDILGSLQQIGGLTVISSTSVRRYRGRDVLLPEIARELRVDAVGEGTVSRGGDRIRVNVQLIDGASDAHLWSEQFDRELSVTDVFAIRTEIARAVARAMRATLTSREEARLATTPPASLTAYDWVHIARSRCDGCEDRGEAYRRALEADSTYAVAWAGLAGNYAVRVLAFGAQTALADSALAFADRALEDSPARRSSMPAEQRSSSLETRPAGPTWACSRPCGGDGWRPWTRIGVR